MNARMDESSKQMARVVRSLKAAVIAPLPGVKFLMVLRAEMGTSSKSLAATAIEVWGEHGVIQDATRELRRPHRASPPS